MIDKHTETSLNSIMFLLIRVSPETLICLVAFFKFHYVSINSDSDKELIHP